MAGLVATAMPHGGFISLQTSATGAAWVTFGQQLAKRLRISNQTATTISVQQNGVGAFLIPTGEIFVMEGLQDCNEIGIQRADVSNVQVTVTARWEGMM